MPGSITMSPLTGLTSAAVLCVRPRVRPAEDSEPYLHLGFYGVFTR